MKTLAVDSAFASARQDQSQGSRRMKPSGVPWLGDIPAGWEFPRIHSLFFEVNEKYSPTQDGEMPLLSVSEYYGVAPRADKIDEDAILVRAESLDGYKKCQKGDIIINIMLAWKNALGVAPCSGIVSPAYCVYRSRKELDARYFHHLFRTKRYGDVFRTVSTGIIDSRLRLYTDKFFSIHAPFPPLPEQRAIADFLDEKCAAIDAIVEEAKSGIEEYAKWKQSVVFQAVTKGIPEGERHPTSDHRLPGDSRLSTSDGPDVESRMSDVEKGSRKSDVGRRKSRPMKDSGVEWIGEIPEEWEVVKVKSVANITNGSDPKTEGSIPVYGSGAESFKTCGEFKQGPTVLLGRKGATLHIPHYIEGLYWNVDTAFDVKMKSGDCLRWFFYLSSCFDYKAFISQTTLPSMTQSNYNSMSMPLPPLPEQRAIAAYLDEKCAAIDALIEEKKQLIEDLGVYKKSLIYETVTGKRRAG